MRKFTLAVGLTLLPVDAFAGSPQATIDCNTVATSTLGRCGAGWFAYYQDAPAQACRPADLAIDTSTTSVKATLYRDADGDGNYVARFCCVVGPTGVPLGTGMGECNLTPSLNGTDWTRLTTPPSAFDDCDDADSRRAPDNADVVANGIDEDCNGSDRCYIDSDGDGDGRNTTAQPSTPDPGCPTDMCDCDVIDGFSRNNDDNCDNTALRNDPVDWRADCDGDMAFGTTLASACTAATTSFPGTCDVQLASDPFLLDCDDSDGASRGDPEWYADCDGDGLFGLTSVDACTRNDAAAAFRALTTPACTGTFNLVRGLPPVTDQDCDDTRNNPNGGPLPWRADCDNDFAYRREIVYACDRDTAEAEFIARFAECDAAGANGFNLIQQEDTGFYDCNDASQGVGFSQDWWGDCDGDGYRGVDTVDACNATEARAAFTDLLGITCANNAVFQTFPFCGPSGPCIPDCDDTFAGGFFVSPFFGDCDGDGQFGSQVVQACGPNQAAAAFRSLTSRPQCSDVSSSDVDGADATINDCDDDDAQEFTGQMWIADCDNDGFYGDEVKTACDEAGARNAFQNYCKAIRATTPNTTVDENTASGPNLTFDVIQLGFEPSLDCWDGDAEFSPGTVWYADCDGDGSFSLSATEACDGLTALDTLCDGFTVCDPFATDLGRIRTARPNFPDCDDNDCTVRPGATETIPGRDYNCDGRLTCFADADNDGYGAGDGSVTVQVSSTTPGIVCEAADGFSSIAGDCQDDEPTVSPVGLEFPADGLDQDCTGKDLCYVDVDGDGFGFTGERDCNDDGVPDGAGATREADASFPPGLSCDEYAELGAGVSGSATDCDDCDPKSFPGQEWLPDCDGDGFPIEDEVITACCERDCPSAAINAIVCPNGTGPLRAFVNDSAAPTLDCLDNDPTRFPGKTSEVCELNGPQLDDDCNGDVNTWGANPRIDATEPVDTAADTDTGAPATNLVEAYNDNDGDGFGDENSPLRLVCAVVPGLSPNNFDCDDQAATTFPGAFEICDFNDQNCNGQIDEGDAIDVDNPEDAFCIVLYRDRDRDGAGDPEAPRCVCPDPPSTAPIVDPYADIAAFLEPLGSLTPLKGSFRGESYVAAPSDCDDEHANIKPHECNDGIDNDGDGRVDAEDPACSNPLRVPAGFRSASERNLRTTAETRPDLSVVVKERIDGHDNECDGFVPIIELDCDDDGSFPRVAPGPDWFANATEIGLERCDPAFADESVSCWGETLELDCDPYTGLWVTRYGVSDDGFGGRYQGGFRRLTNPGGCATFGDCDDQCASRCPGGDEVCDGVDNDCSLLGEPDVEGSRTGVLGGLPAAMESGTRKPGTVLAAEIDFDGDGYAACAEDFLRGGSAVHEAFLDCTGFTDDVLRSDCQDFCYLTNDGATEVCNGFTDVCGAPPSAAEGFDLDGDNLVTCGAYGPADIDLPEQVFVTVWASCDVDAQSPSLQTACCDAGITSSCPGGTGAQAPPEPAVVPLLATRERAKVCDEDLGLAVSGLVTAAGGTEADLTSSSRIVRSVCTNPLQTRGVCTIVELLLDRTDDAVPNPGDVSAECEGEPQEYTLRTVWPRERILDARRGVIEAECLRLFGTTCDTITVDTPRVSRAGPPNVDGLLKGAVVDEVVDTAALDSIWWQELGRFAPVSAGGAVMSCWGDPRVEDMSVRTGGDCDDTTVDASRDLPEGPYDLVATYLGLQGDCDRCLDNIDNNCDGLTDCADPTCSICFVGRGTGCAGARDACVPPPEGGGCTTGGGGSGVPLVLLAFLGGWRRRRSWMSRAA